MSIPSSIRVFVERTPTSFRAYDKPTTIRSLLAQNREEILAETAWRAVVAISADTNVHLLYERTVEEIEWTLVLVVIHILDICFEGPIDGLCSENDVAVLFQHSFGRPPAHM